MATSALQQSNTVPAFEDPYYNFNPEQYYDDSTYYGDSGIPGWWMSLMGHDMSNMREQEKTLQNQAYERASINSARAWAEYMDNTQYQRRVEDLKKAGLNPWLAVQNGISGSGSPSVDTGGSAKHESKSGQSKSILGMLLMALAKMAG